MTGNTVTDILSHTVFGVISAYCSNCGHFVCLFKPLVGGLRSTYDDHLGLIGKRVVDFLLVLIELLLGVTAEALRAKIERKSAHCKGWVADSIYTKMLCSRLSLSEMRFYTKNGRFAFLSPLFGGLWATYTTIILGSLKSA